MKISWLFPILLRSAIKCSIANDQFVHNLILLFEFILQRFMASFHIVWKSS